MKKIIKIVMICFILCMTTGCVGGLAELVGDSTNEIMDGTAETIMKSLETGDAEAIKALFSKEALDKAENIDEQIQEAIDFFDGSVQDYIPAHSEYRTNHHGIRVTEYKGLYTIQTDKEKYEMRFCIFRRNDDNPDMEGVMTIELVPYEKKMQKDFKWQAYWSDGDAGVYIQK